MSSITVIVKVSEELTESGVAEVSVNSTSTFNTPKGQDSVANLPSVGVGEYVASLLKWNKPPVALVFTILPLVASQ
jgi:hypothetical protein